MSCSGDILSSPLFSHLITSSIVLEMTRHVVKWSSWRWWTQDNEIRPECSVQPWTCQGFSWSSGHCKSPCCNVDLKSDILFIVGLDWLAATVRVGTWSIWESKKKGRAGFDIHNLKVISNLNVMFGLFSCLPHLFSNECCLCLLGLWKMLNEISNCRQNKIIPSE